MTVLFAFALLITGAAAGACIYRTVERRRLAQLARSWQMHFSPHDVFHLGQRVAPHLPLPGAATVRVRDCIYGSESGGHRYIFRAEYTVGVIRSKHRHFCIVAILEPRRRDDPLTWDSLRVADSALAPIDQYTSLHTPSRPTAAS